MFFSVCHVLLLTQMALMFFGAAFEETPDKQKQVFDCMWAYRFIFYQLSLSLGSDH